VIPRAVGQIAWPWRNRPMPPGCLVLGMAVFRGQLLLVSAHLRHSRPCTRPIRRLLPARLVGSARSASASWEDKPAITLGFEQIASTFRAARLDSGPGPGQRQHNTSGGLSRQPSTSVRSIQKAAAMNVLCFAGGC